MSAYEPPRQIPLPSFTQGRIACHSFVGIFSMARPNSVSAAEWREWVAYVQAQNEAELIEMQP